MGGRGSGGHNKRPAEQHLLTGTLRPDRHGPLDRGNLAVVSSPPSPPARRAPDTLEIRRLLKGLSRAQRALGRRLLDEFAGWETTDLVLLRLTLQALDRAEECRGRIAEEGLVLTSERGGSRPHPMIRPERQAAAFAANAFRQLNLGGVK